MRVLESSGLEEVMAGLAGLLLLGMHGWAQVRLAREQRLMVEHTVAAAAAVGHSVRVRHLGRGSRWAQSANGPVMADQVSVSSAIPGSGRRNPSGRRRAGSAGRCR